MAKLGYYQKSNSAMRYNYSSLDNKSKKSGFTNRQSDGMPRPRGALGKGGSVPGGMHEARRRDWGLQPATENGSPVLEGLWNA
jgi:hypothetical protein